MLVFREYIGIPSAIVHVYTAWAVCGRYVGGMWEVCGRYMGGIWAVYEGHIYWL